MCSNAILLVEEVLGLQKDFSNIDITLSYSEKSGHLAFIFKSMGFAVNPLMEGIQEDDIGISLIKGICENIQYSYEQGKNMIVARVKGK